MNILVRKCVYISEKMDLRVETKSESSETEVILVESVVDRDGFVTLLL